MYAIVASGGKQYKVSEGDRVRVEKLSGEKGNALTFDQVLFVGGGKTNPKIGTPTVAGASVTGEIIAQQRDKKVLVFKRKKRKGFKKMIGHRQNFTEVKITKIHAGKKGAEVGDGA